MIRPFASCRLSLDRSDGAICVHLLSNVPFPCIQCSHLGSAVVGGFRKAAVDFHSQHQYDVDSFIFRLRHPGGAWDPVIARAVAGEMWHVCA